VRNAELGVNSILDGADPTIEPRLMFDAASSSRDQNVGPSENEGINFPLSKQPADQMVRDAVDTAIKLYASAWERCERGGEL
jgi:hypothetical protein